MNFKPFAYPIILNIIQNLQFMFFGALNRGIRTDGWRGLVLLMLLLHPHILTKAGELVK